MGRKEIARDYNAWIKKDKRIKKSLNVMFCTKRWTTEKDWEGWFLNITWGLGKYWYQWKIQWKRLFQWEDLSPIEEKINYLN